MGDSLTAGIPGVSYCHFLHHKTKLINKGVGGDTLLGATSRVQKLLSNPRYHDVNQYIIEIGTNDVLLPVLQKHSFAWKTIISIKAELMGCVPCKDIEIFRIKYEELLQTLSHQNKKVAVLGLPLIENSILIINDIMKEYDAVIAELCQRYNCPYLDVRQLELNLKGSNNGTYFFGKTNLGNMVDTVFSSLLPFSMLISRLRGLAVTIDGVHLNTKTAKALAAAIEITLL